MLKKTLICIMCCLGISSEKSAFSKQMMQYLFTAKKFDDREIDGGAPKFNRQLQDINEISGMQDVFNTLQEFRIKSYNALKNHHKQTAKQAIPDTKIVYHSITNPLYKSDNINLNTETADSSVTNIQKFSSPFETNWLYYPKTTDTGALFQSIPKFSDDSSISPTSFKFHTAKSSPLDDFNDMNSLNDIRTSMIPNKNREVHGYNYQEVKEDGKTRGVVNVFNKDGITKHIVYDENGLVNGQQNESKEKATTKEKVTTPSPKKAKENRKDQSKNSKANKSEKTKKSDKSNSKTTLKPDIRKYTTVSKSVVENVAIPKPNILPEPKILNNSNVENAIESFKSFKIPTTTPVSLIANGSLPELINKIDRKIENSKFFNVSTPIINEIKDPVNIPLDRNSGIESPEGILYNFLQKLSTVPKTLSSNTYSSANNAYQELINENTYVYNE